jgi:hypothetical protein
MEKNDLTPTQKQPWYKNKRTLLRVLGGGVILIAILVVVIVIVAGKKPCKDKCIEEEPECYSCDCEPSLPGCDVVVNITHKLYEASVYEDSTTKTSTIVYNDENSSGRRLNEKSIKTTSSGKYLLNIYDVDNSTSNIVYSAYAVLLNLENDKTGKNTKVGGSDVRNSNEDFPFIKFSFDSKGEISELKVPEDYDKTLIAYIYEFIEKVVPQLSSNLYGEDKNRKYEKDGENNNLIKTDLKGIEGFDGSKEERNIKATVNNGTIKSVYTNTKNSYSQKKEYQMSTAENNFTAELAGPNKNVTRESPIKSYEEYLESNLNLESSDIDETLTKKLMIMLIQKLY